MKQNESIRSFPALLQDFFCKRLVDQKNASSKTIASYRDTFRLLLQYREKKTGKTPSALSLADLDASSIIEFLSYLERDRKNSARSRNVRLAAIRSFMTYVSHCDPRSIALVQRVLAIPMKRFDRPLIGYLTREEVEAILKAPDQSNWSGHRDSVMFSTFYNTGARVSEIIGLRVADVSLGRQSVVRIRGKGRKHRSVPLWKSTASQLRHWFQHLNGGENSPVFPSCDGEPLSRSGVENRLKLAVEQARQVCPSLKDRRISPHVLRHTTAMHLLQAGVDITVIALWLGHESIETTHMYLEADLAMKEKALKTIQDPKMKGKRFKASDHLLSFLEQL